MPDRPHFSFPFTRIGGKVRVVEQDTIEHVQACEQVIIRCPSGFREDRPEFGWPFPEFYTLPLDLSSLRDSLSDLEPRGPSMSTREYADQAQQAIRHIQIDVGVESDE